MHDGWMEEAARGGGDCVQARPAAGEEGMTAITKYDVGSIGGGMATPVTSTSERMKGREDGRRAVRRRQGLADEEARHKVEEGGRHRGRPSTPRRRR